MSLLIASIVLAAAALAAALIGLALRPRAPAEDDDPFFQPFGEMPVIPAGVADELRAGPQTAHQPEDRQGPRSWDLSKGQAGAARLCVGVCALGSHARTPAMVHASDVAQQRVHAPLRGTTL